MIDVLSGELLQIWRSLFCFYFKACNSLFRVFVFVFAFVFVSAFVSRGRSAKVGFESSSVLFGCASS